MNQKEFSEAFAGKHGTTKVDAFMWSRAIFSFLEEKILEDGYVYINGLGVFEIKEAKPRHLVHPITKKDVYVPAGKRVKFTPSADMERRLNSVKDSEKTEDINITP